MTDGRKRARDLQFLDAIDAFKREPFTQPVWRIAREGRDPAQGEASKSRWCDGTFDVLYTSLGRDGALAEIYALLNSQPVFPSRLRSFVHKLKVNAKRALRLADLQTLEKLGVDTRRYRERDYSRTASVAEAAYFLDFDGLVAPSARWDCLNAMLFTDRMAPADIEIAEDEPEAVDWKAWKRAMSRGPKPGCILSTRRL